MLKRVSANRKIDFGVVTVHKLRKRAVLWRAMFRSPRESTNNVRFLTRIRNQFGASARNIGDLELFFEHVI